MIDGRRRAALALALAAAAAAAVDDGAPLTRRVDRPTQVVRRGRDVALIDPDNEQIG